MFQYIQLLQNKNNKNNKKIFNNMKCFYKKRIKRQILKK